MTVRLLVTSAVCTLMVFFLSTFICNKYYEKNYYGYDPVDGLLNNMKAYNDVKHQGRVQAAVNQYESNPNTPFIPIAISLIAPELFLKLSGHLLLTLPLFFSFLYLWGYLLHKMNVPPPLIIVLLFAYSSTWALYGPYSGIAFYLRDVIASYPLAISGVSLLIWRIEKKHKWLVVFSLMLSISVLTRYIFSVYAFILFAPLLMWLFYIQYREGGNKLNEIIKQILLIGSIVLLLTGFFIVKNYSHNTGYYVSWVDQTLGLNRWESLKSFVKSFPPFFGRMHWATFAIIVSIQAYLFYKRRDKFETIAIATWLILALPIFWTLIMGTDGLKVRAAFLAAFPVTWVALTTFYPIDKSSASKKLVISACAFIFLLSAVHIWRSYKIFVEQIDYTDETYVALKSATVTLAQQISPNKLNSPEHTIADITGMYLAETIAVEFFYKTGNAINLDTKIRKIFSPEKTYWKGNTKTQEQINKKIYQEIVKTCDLVITKEPDIKQLPFSQSREAAKYITEQLTNNVNWKSSTSKANGFLLMMFERKPN